MDAVAAERPRRDPAPAEPELALVPDEETAPPGDAAKREEFRREALPHLEDLYAFALRLTGGEEADAEDLVQVAMLRAFRSWETYEVGTNCGAWLRTILRNCFVNRFRRGERRPDSVAYEKLEGVSRYDGDSEQSRSTDPFPRPDEAVFDGMVDDEVVEAVEGLDPRFRVPLVLVDVDGLTYGEVAESLDLPVGTVKSRLYRARRKLRDELREYGRRRGYGG